MRNKPKDIKEFVDKVADNTFETLHAIYKNERPLYPQDNGHSRLIFPNGKEKDAEIEEENDLRVSEQELRFTFIEEFYKLCSEKYCDYLYSVETPTIGHYDFKTDEKKPQRVPQEKGQSGNFDMVIHNKENKRVCLIEFKALNVLQEKIEKDYVKLMNEEEGNGDVMRYFIHLLPSHNSGTVKNVRNKLNKIKDRLTKEYNNSITVEYRCYSLKDGTKLTIEE